MEFAVAAGIRGHGLSESLLLLVPTGWWEEAEGDRRGIAGTAGESPDLPSLRTGSEPPGCDQWEQNTGTDSALNTEQAETKEQGCLSLEA